MLIIVTCCCLSKEAVICVGHHALNLVAAAADADAEEDYDADTKALCDQLGSGQRKL
jgi:hypothetical protein